MQPFPKFIKRLWSGFRATLMIFRKFRAHNRLKSCMGVWRGRDTVEALLTDTLVCGSSTDEHLDKTPFELPYKFCIYSFS